MTDAPRRYTLADFDYEFPTELIAQRPTARRGAGRLLVAERASDRLEHLRFDDFPSLLRTSDVLVRNASRVVPARLRGTRPGGHPAEVLLVHPAADDTWLAMVHPGDKLRAGRRVRFGDDAQLEIVGIEPDGLRRVRFTGALDARDAMARYGDVPLPPYIEREADALDRERYQTVYATRDGSVAAPTAGLHFTEDLLARIRDRHVHIVDVVLHVGPGTFKPVETDDPADHTMHAEWYEVPDATAATINQACTAGGRIWAVGTTAARTLETVAARRGGRAAEPRSPPRAIASTTDASRVVAGSGWTDLFIHPPYRFTVVDALLTNFHLPRSTLLMLVTAFAGHELTLRAYREAVARRYRLYSYGDAMAIV